MNKCSFISGIRRRGLRRGLLCLITLALPITVFCKSCIAQSAKSEGGKLAFEVASIRENRSARAATSNFPLDSGNSYGNVGSLFSATGYTLPFYMYFALKLNDYQEGVILSTLPGWAKMTRFDIQARAVGAPSKDEMRQMLVTLLEDRFRLAFHHEMQNVPVFWLELVKPRKTGPTLRAHSTSVPCSGPTANDTGSHDLKTPITAAQPTWPPSCGILDSKMTEAGLLRVGARDVTLQWITNVLIGANDFGRPMADHTGLSGTYDFSIDFVPHYNRTPPGGGPQFDENGPSFVEALKDQLGIKLTSHKDLEDITVIDHLEYPSPN